MLLRATRNVARRTSSRAVSSGVEPRRAFVQPSTQSRASVVDTPPPVIRETEEIFRPRAGEYGPSTCQSLKLNRTDMLGFKLGRRDTSTEKARPIYLDFQVMNMPALCCRSVE